MADPKLGELTAEAAALNKELQNLKRLLGEFSTPSSQFKNNFNTVKTSLASTAKALEEAIGKSSSAPTTGKSLPTPSQPSTVWSKARVAVGGAAAMAEAREGGASWIQSAQVGYRAMTSPPPPPPPPTSTGSMGGGPGGPISISTPSNDGGGGGGFNPLASAVGMLQKASDIYGSIAGAGLQFAYNRIEGPTGNRNSILQLAQALGPNAGMMGMDVNTLLTGLAQRAPVLGSNADIIGTILAGQSVGAFMSGRNAPAASGIPGRSGFFESVRQMQLLTPGVAAGSMATTLSNYLGNTQSQQMGMFLGQGAFTMVGQGGRYKSLAEWAESILKFLSEQRPGGTQGTRFSKDELMAQNFPGSNINAWFRMMGTPQTMVDYWWQYALANADKRNPITKSIMRDGQYLSPTEIMQSNIAADRGMDLGYERLRSVTQGTRRDYLMGTQMYGLYNAREAADRRFNVGMQAADLTIGQLARTTNAGAAMALFPTPIMEMLLPIMLKLASSPIGTALSLAGNVEGAIKGAGSIAGGIFNAINPLGDPPVGDYGPLGSSSTKHLSPDLAKRVDAMLSANPRLKISSGYRDTVTQNRLYKNGVGRVGPASKSAHTRGWAVDIGPTSELGWLQANAGRFGLQTASNVGEPWHVQMDGTMPVGDMPVGDIFSDIISGGFNFAKGAVGTGFDILKGAGGSLLSSSLLGGGGLMGEVLNRFISGGNLSGLIDNAISWFIKLMTAPLSGLAKVFGNANFTEDDIRSLVNKPSAVKVNVSTYAGFTPSTNPAITGKNSAPIFGDPISMASSQPANISARIESPIIFKTEIHIAGNSSNSPVDVYKTANSMADALEDVLSKRQWRKS